MVNVARSCTAGFRRRDTPVSTVAIWRIRMGGLTVSASLFEPFLARFDSNKAMIC